MSGLHRIQVTYVDGSTLSVDCPCEWCVIWRSVEDEILRRLAEHEQPVWPAWLGPEREVVL